MPGIAQPNDFLPDPPLFRRRLLSWFRREGRDLPWRRTRDPYAILVSEFMLQQTQVAAVIPFYQRWLARFPDVAALARANESAVLHAWQGLGYYTRARHLQATARALLRDHGGRVPPDPARLRQLPGIGRYTAGAIATFAFDLPEPIVDANVARVLARLTNYKLAIDSAAGCAHLWRIAAALVPPNGACEYNSALMDLGAIVCLPRAPRCRECPVWQSCQAVEPALLPQKRKRPAVIHLTEAHAFARGGNRVLLEQSRTRWRGMWILPRLSPTPVQPPLLELDFPFTHHRVTLAVFARPERILPNEHQKWFSLRALSRLPVATPHRRALSQLLPEI